MTPQQNTKIERVVEGVESLATAIVGAHPYGGHRQFENVQNARRELREALAEVFKPVLIQ